MGWEEETTEIDPFCFRNHPREVTVEEVVVEVTWEEEEEVMGAILEVTWEEEVTWAI